MDDILFPSKVTAKILGITTRCVLKGCNEGRFPNAFKNDNGEWRIPSSDIISYQDRRRELIGKRVREDERCCENTLSTVEVAEMLEFASSNTVARYCKQGLFPNAFKYKGYWRIPIKEAESYQRSHFFVRHDACPECGIITGGSLCKHCEAAKEGVYYWYEATPLSSAWMHGCSSCE